jgi:glucose uptake protein
MLLPSGHSVLVALAALACLCWGLWPNFIKVAGPRWRFELFYFDFAVGAMIASLLAAFTLGTFGSDLTFSDRLLIAGRTGQVVAFGSGAIFNLGNMLLVAAVSLAGIATTVPLSVGTGMVVTACVDFYFNPQGHWVLACAGAALMVAGVCLDAAAIQTREREQPTLPGAKARKRTSGRAIFICVLSGVFWGISYPIFERVAPGDLGLGPYGALVMVAIGVGVSTLFFNIYFMNIRMVGEQIKLKAYFRGTPKQHFSGFVGGALWATGALCCFLGGTASPAFGAGPLFSLVFAASGALLCAVWGPWIWKEFAGAGPKTKRLAWGYTALLLAGFILLGLAYR